MSPELQTFLSLVRAGIGHPVGELPDAIDWERMEALAEEHGLSAVLWDAVDRLAQEGMLEEESLSPCRFRYVGGELRA